MFLFRLARDEGKNFGIDRGAVWLFKAIDVLDLDRRIGDHGFQRLEKLVRRFTGQQTNVEIARRSVGDDVCLLTAAEHRYRDRVAHEKVELALTRECLCKLRVFQ